MKKTKKAFTANASIVNSFWKWFKGVYFTYELSRAVVPLILLIIVSIALAPGYFLKPINIKVILMQLTPLTLIATGEMLIILMGSIDLSPGSALAATAMLSALVIRRYGSLELAILVAIALGTMIGAINGLLVSKFKIYSFVATLAALVIWRSFVIVISGGKLIYGLTAYNVFVQDFGTYIPLGFVITLMIVIAIYFMLTRTVLGRYIYGIGSNEDAVRLAGIRADLAKFLAFTLAGTLYGIGGVMLIAMSGLAVDPWTARGFELNAIASCVLGGVMLTGGSGHPLSGLLGAAILTILSNILVLLGITEIAVQQTVVGIVLIAAATALTRGLKYAK
ncbi:ABC transporter permease [Ignisphaera sp. 4213-co]|uniref:ABC transporter permease n=1 Tax=Ignisphaera cupida TaxID=3050454 RepID=A0ABD4Z7A9_9CREN|nr:ABC transporter permease [Ignisphaera sp. 4213-co]MDK6029019.1 ABC transporter permease [Ignisphaera sp. 4213-co]